MFGGAASGGSGFSFGQNKPASVGTGFSFGANNNNNNTAAAGAGTGAGSTGFGFGAKPLGAGTSTPTSGGLFGGNNNSNIPQPGGANGFSFGGNNNNNTNNAGTTGGLFGAAKPAGVASSGGFGFGNNASTAANTGTGLNFGSGANNAAPAASSGGLFGNKPLGTTGAGTSLFPNNANNSAAPAMGSGGLFGNKPATGGTSLFGNNNASSQFSFGAKPAMATGGGLFGSASSTTPANGGLFGQQNNQFQQQQQQQQQPALQLSAMSKVSELPPDVQNELKQLDEYIQTQVSIAEYLKSQEAEHQELITSVPRDINYLEKSYASTNQALTADLKFVESFKSNTLESFNSWAEKLIKVYLQLTNPMSSSTNDQGQIQGSSKVVIGVSGNRIESAQEAAQQQQQQQQQQQKQKQKEKTNYVNVTSILNSYYLDKIEDFKGKIHNYELILEEVENCVNDLEQNRNMSIGGGMDLIVNTLREEFKLYVELTNEFAEIHHKINSMANGQDRF